VKVKCAFSLSLVILAVCPALVFGQGAFPTKPIQVFVGMAPGGSMDMLTRALAQDAKRYLGQEVVVVNKPGAAGSSAAAQIAAAKPDGYTLCVTPSSTFTVTPFIQDLPMDLIKENTPILGFAKFDVTIYVKSENPVKGLKDLIEFARQNPGKVTYGTPGTGTKAHLVMAAIAAQEGVKMIHMPFAGDLPTATAVLGGHVTAGASSPAGPIAHVEAGTLKIIAVVGDERMDAFPTIPTVVELGYPYPLPVVHLLHGPKGLPEPIEKKLEDAFEKASKSAMFEDIAVKNMLYLRKHMFGKDLGTFLLNERTKTGELIQKLGLGKK
jgi:tripartite-type tricarboxylate transporter receptor subunit TctC